MHAGMPRDAAKRIVTAACLLHGSIWGLCWGESWRTKHYVFWGRVAAAGDEGQLLCEAVAAGVALACDWFLQGVLHCAVARVCVGIGRFGTGGCRSQCSGCMIVVLFCCHVRR